MSAKGTLLEKVVRAIRVGASPSGSSLVYIKKYLKAEEDYENNTMLLKTLKKAVEEKKLVKDGGSYKIPGEVYSPPLDEVVTIQQLEEGSGPEAASGNTVTMSYEGRLEDGTVFDSADKFKFTIDAGEVIKGWDKGVKGMKKGAKRRLIIPPKLGYGKKGSPPEIPPNATLDFTVTLLSISK